MSEPVVLTDQLTKVYGDLTALDRLSIQVGRGKILGFVGPNGAGKTTTIKILVGLARPTSGFARIAGADCVRDARRIKHLVGYMPDAFGSFDNMRVREYLDFFGAAFKIPWRKRKARIDAVLETTGSTYMQDRYVETLSHGMQQRIAIARTLLHDPEVLILDEPANGLDPHARIEMRELLLRLASMGKTLIVTSHVLPELARICDQVAIITNGRTSHVLPELARICDQVAIITNGRLRAAGTLDEIMQRVRQKRMIEVQLAAQDQTEPAVAALHEILGDDAEITPSLAEAIVRFETSQSEEDLGNVLRELIQHGVRVTQFREVPSDLEDAFLSVTRAEAEEAQVC
jgi:ABC-2 type transport system ATP-binding protein